MAVWIYFASSALADQLTTQELAIRHRVIVRNPLNSNNALVANVGNVKVGDEIYLAFRGPDSKIILSARIATPHHPHEKAEAIDMLTREEVAELFDFQETDYSLGDDGGIGVFRLEDVEECSVSLSGKTFPQNSLQRFPSNLSVASTSKATLDGAAASFLFPYVGELMLEKILGELKERLLDTFGLEVMPISVRRQVPVRFPSANIRFDGTGTLDLAFVMEKSHQIHGRFVMPVELKLGFTGLTKASVDKMLTPCNISGHEGIKRISGKMLAALNGNWSEALQLLKGNEPLHAEVDGQWLPVSREWFTIVRELVLLSWKNKSPAFNDSHKAVSVESICRSYGEENFNTLADSLFSKANFFKMWIGGEA